MLGQKIKFVPTFVRDIDFTKLSEKTNEVLYQYIVEKAEKNYVQEMIEAIKVFLQRLLGLEIAPGKPLPPHVEHLR